MRSPYQDTSDNSNNSDYQYNLDSTYITNFNLHLQHLKNNSDSIINDLCILEKLLEEIKIYNNQRETISSHTSHYTLYMYTRAISNSLHLTSRAVNIDTDTC